MNGIDFNGTSIFPKKEDICNLVRNGTLPLSQIKSAISCLGNNKCIKSQDKKQVLLLNIDDIEICVCLQKRESQMCTLSSGREEYKSN